MKQLYFIIALLFIGLNGKANKSQLADIIIEFSAINLNSTYEVGDVIDFNFKATNNVTPINLTAKFELIATGQIIAYTEMVELELNLGINNYTMPFNFPASCFSLEDGQYELKASYSYSAEDSDGITISTYDENQNGFCLNDGIDDVCEHEIGSINFTNICCFVPEIQLSATLVNPKFPCYTLVTAEVDFNGADVDYSLEWNTGARSHTITHVCGNIDYDVTVYWGEDNITCSVISETINANSSCYCADTTDDNEPFELPDPNQIDLTKIFPNPNQGQFQIEFPTNKSVASFEIRNSNGHIVWSESGSLVTTYSINLSNALEGQYFLLVFYQDQSNEIQQFLIQ